MVTLSFNLSQLVTWIIIGAIAGFLAGLLIRGRHMGTLWNVIIGLIGAVVGGVLFNLLHIPIPAALNAGIELKLADIIIAFVGAVVVLLIAALIYRRRP
jgi:uncharacterized membrane protein YeaQ/YmgE (transglycosylase-associated protein family)